MSTIDEIQRLHSLLNKGAISNQEFEMLKQNLLSDSKNKDLIEVEKEENPIISKLKKSNKIEKPIPNIGLKNIVLKKIACTNCGAELLFDPSTQLTNCNFCGSHFEIKKSVDEEVIIPDGIVPFSVSKESYEANTLAWLSQGDYTPIDILESSVFSEINGVYIPVWYYHGKYHGNWSASSGYDYEQEYTVQENGKLVTRTRIVTDWRPSSGNCDGELKAIGFASDDPKSELVTFTYFADITLSAIKEYDSRYTLGFNLMEFNKKSDIETWEEYGITGADMDIEFQVRKRIPGDHYKDFHVEASFDKDQPIRIYIPAWITYYNYNSNKYYVLMDGKDYSRIDGLRPEDEKTKNKAEFFLKIFKKWWIVVVVWLTIGIIHFFVTAYSKDSNNEDNIKSFREITDFGSYTLFILIAIWPLLKVASNIQMKAVINTSKKRRQQILARVKKLNKKSKIA